MVGKSLYPPNSKAARAAATTIHSQLQALRPYLLSQHALDIPDFTLNISPAFHTTHTTVTASKDIAGGDTVTYQSLSMASRPRIVSFIRDKIVHLGQARQRFSRMAERVSLSTLSAEEQRGLVYFSDPADEVRLDGEGNPNLLASSAAQPLNLVTLTRCLKMIIIGGPRHVGKSHIMLQVAALFASEPSAVVLYVGSCSDLVLCGIDSDRARYIQFIEHVVCAGAMHPEVAGLADRWYRATRMGTDIGAMGVATTVFMRELSKLGAEREADIVLFLDDCEALLGVDPLLAVINIRFLIEQLGVVVVATSSASASASASAVASGGTFPKHDAYQCTVAAALAPEEAMDVFFATHGHLDISDGALERIFEAAEYHPLDIVLMLSQYGNKRSLLGSSADEGQAIASLISDGEFARNSRISQMHLRYLRESLAAAAQATEEPLEHEGMAREIISAERSPQLLRVKCDISQAAFAILHGLQPKHCLARDLQFAEPEGISTPDAASYVRCFPPAAAEIMYRAHYSGLSAEEQFQWLFGSASAKFSVDPQLRLRYFDALLLDSGRIRGSARRLSGGALDFDIRFAHVMSFAGRRGQRIEPRLCTTFAEAAEAVARYIEALRARAPAYEPKESRRETRSAGAMLHFPRLGFREPWMSPEVRSSSHYEGSFMAAVVRVDRLLDGRAEWGSTEFEVTWIANDPLGPSTAGSGGMGSESGPAMGKADPDATLDVRSTRPPKDTTDFDAAYGVGGSWSAKALRIFPDIQRLCKGEHTSARMLVVAADKRFAEIVSGDAARILGTTNSGGTNDTHMSVMGTSALGQRVRSQILAHI
ncbi:hypothetical protein IWW37_004861 [Coemansia sp. RSA 2050]|nr:hypothetical protein IWW37_004861 [Coemansia sp. RSA 2050]KAJ2731084.1 hypothetical protein IW152_004790 [Coemansia sp. BCRC 34962]